MVSFGHIMVALPRVEYLCGISAIFHWYSVWKIRLLSERHSERETIRSGRFQILDNIRVRCLSKVESLTLLLERASIHRLNYCRGPGPFLKNGNSWSLNSRGCEQGWWEVIFNAEFNEGMYFVVEDLAFDLFSKNWWPHSSLSTVYIYLRDSSLNLLITQ